MTPFDIVEPRSVKEAIALIDPDDADVRVIAGGTALMLLMKAGVFRPRRLISLRKFGDSLSGIATTPSGELRIGAMTPLSAAVRPGLTLARSATVPATNGVAIEVPL